MNDINPKKVLSICALLIAITLGWSETGDAAGMYDPALRWRTIETERFRVHYAEGARDLAWRVLEIAEESLTSIIELFGFKPSGRIDIVLNDSSDSANGSAQVLPRNTIRLLLSAPTEISGLAQYDDWLRILVLHELAHICDIDQTWGVTRIMRLLLGKEIAMNGLTPQFLSEGVAVYAETLLTQSGRGRSSYVRMILRLAALHDSWVGIDQANIQYGRWPGGQAAYFYGGMFHIWLAKRFGPPSVPALHRYNAAMPLPYLYWIGSQATFKQSLESLWDEWRQQVKKQAQRTAATVQRLGETRSTSVTTAGGQISGARFSPNAEQIVYSRRSPVDGATVRVVDRNGKDDHRLVLQTYSPRFSFVPNGAGLVFSQAAINERYNTFSDLYFYSFKSKKTRRLRDVAMPSRSLRARSPDISRDGKRLVFVQNSMGQSWLSIGDIIDIEKGQITVRTLVPPQGMQQQASPRFSPDGKWVAVSTWFENGHRDIVLVDPVTGEQVKRLTNDKALDGNPAWSPDGRYVLFESDVDGIFNIYAYDIETGERLRLTRVVGGAFQPDVSSDGRSLLFRRASSRGFDIVTMPYKPSTWKPYRARQQTAVVGMLALDGQWQKPKLMPAKSAASVGPVSARRSLQAREYDYKPWSTLLPFQHNWFVLPAFSIVNGDAGLELTTMGQDVLGRHTYGLSLGSSLATKRLDWMLSYVNNVWEPTIQLSGGQQNFVYSTEQPIVLQHSSLATLAVGWPWRLRHAFLASFSYDKRQVLQRDIKKPLQEGQFNRLQLAYQYNWARRYAYSVSPEHGRRLALGARWSSRAFGASFDEVILSTDGRLYLNIPWADNQVIALRGVVVLALGPDDQERYVLGGYDGSSVYSVNSDTVYPLRGFVARWDEGGSGLFSMYLEYRLPFWHIQHGLWTLPVFFKRLHGAFFTDLGTPLGHMGQQGISDFFSDAWQRLKKIRVGVGAELRLDVSLGWRIGLTLRGGVAWPTVDQGRFNTAAWKTWPQFYFALGTVI